jgi:hypothetical protein
MGAPQGARAELDVEWARHAELGDGGLASDMVVSPLYAASAAAEARVFLVWGELRKLALALNQRGGMLAE